MTAVIEVEDLTKKFGSFAAVDGLDLEVRRGEVFAFLGPNGAGKTTTIDILTGAQKRTGGQVRVLGEDPGRDGRFWRCRVGVVPQQMASYADLKVKEVLSHFAAFYPDPYGVDELIDMVGLREKANAMAPSLSGGQARRLDVAVGLVGRPDLVFLDEPTTGLDAKARRSAWDLVRMLSDQGRTTVLTTHYLDEVEALADRAGVIAAGRMRALGTLDELRGSVGRRYRVQYDLRLSRGLDADLAVTAEGEGADATTVTTVATDHPTELLRMLIGEAEAQGMREIPSLRVSEPSFEDTYLSLIADSQKDA